jgi:hypothetical protein
MGYGKGIRIARNALVLLAMQDVLLDRMNLAFGEIRVLGSSKSADVTKENQKKIDRFEAAFLELQEKAFEARELELLSEELVEICADIIADNTEERLQH